MIGRDPLTAMADAVFVLGNGPSLKGVDLNRFSDVATIGMNAAYRYWDQIGWYPTHYCSLDSEMIGSHHRDIRRLVEEGLVESAFLSGVFLEHHPDLVDDNRFVFLDSFRGPWYERRGRALGVPRLSHPAFESSQPSKLTTGAYAVRYGIYLGARRLFLLGIDCNYVELVDGAERLEGTALKMSETPDDNPNYFFADYQREGDRYNIPNPRIHGGNLHLQSLEAVRDDIVEKSLDVEVHNCAAASQLNTRGTFPFMDIDMALGANRLAAVAVPMTSGEVDALISNLHSWAQPEMTPLYPGSDYDAIPFVVVLNGAPDLAVEQRIRSAFASLIPLHRAFTGVEFEYCGLEGELDVYQRDYSAPVGRHGYKAGPNHQFFRSVELMKTYGRYVFMMETDCYPLRPNWLGELQRAVASAEPFWVLGSLYRGLDVVDVRYRRHLNGNAIYAVGDPTFQEFIGTVWREALDSQIEAIKTLAYDCALDLYFRDVGPDHNPDRWATYQRIAHMFRYTDLVQNVSGGVDVAAPGNRDLLRDRNPRTVVVHGRQFAPGEAAKSAELDPIAAVPFEAVLIHQMGKVGSSSIYQSLSKREDWPVYHTHFLHPDDPHFGTDEVAIPERHFEVPQHIRSSIEVREQFLERGRKVAIVTLVREPVARNASAFFQNIQGFIHGTGISTDDPPALCELFLQEYPHGQPDHWIDRELNETFGVDLFAQELHDGKWVKVDSDYGSILVLKTSLDDSVKRDLISRFLGIDGFEITRTNVTEGKDDAAAYGEFKKLVGANLAYVDEMLSLKTAKAFFTQEELDEARRKWQAIGHGG